MLRVERNVITNTIEIKKLHLSCPNFGINTKEINLCVTYLYTFTGRKEVYSLPDMAYGEWIIYKNNYPKYYFNSFDEIYTPYISHLAGKKLGIHNFLKEKLKKLDSSLSLKMNFFGVEIISGAHTKTFTLEKLPLDFLK